MKKPVVFGVSLLGLLCPALRAEKFDVAVCGGTAGGLSWTDFGKKEVIGGYAPAPL
jgi:hypothetical protein